MNKFKIVISLITTILPSRIRIVLMNMLGYKIDQKARLKIFSVILAKDIHIGAFAKIDSFVVIAGLDRLVMKEYTAIQRFTYISGNHLFKINKRSMVGSRCVINAGAGDVEIGEYSAFAPRSSIYTHGTFLPATLGYPTTNSGVKIGDFCWIMQSASIGPGVKIESHSIVLPGSTIVKNISDNLVVYDTPTQRKSFPLYFFKKKLDEAELISLIKEITINYLNTLKSNDGKIDFVVDDEVINIKYKKNKNYKIFFSEINHKILTSDKEGTHIYFYYDMDIKIMKSKNFICYDFKNITKSYPKLPEVLSKFDDYAFAYYGLKFIDIDYL
jgi:acetyltransferase-like isoleucine patch superfamily enzyme